MDRFRILQLAGLLTESQLVEAREDFIAQALGDKLTTAYDNDNGVRKPHLITPLEIVQYLSTHINSNYIQWLAKQYINNQYKLEDVNQVKKDIDTFIRVRAQLPNKDLNSYKNLTQLYDAIKPFESQEIVSGKQQKQAVKESGANKIIDTPNFKVLDLQTEEAAIFYGKGTKWCTAATEAENLFNDYKKTDNVYTILAGGRKFQLCMQKDQFKNEQNQDLTKEDIKYLSKYPEYKHFLNLMIEKYYTE